MFYEHRKTCEMVCLTNCSCGAWFIFFLFNAIICPRTMVYSKEKIVCYRILQSDNCTSFKTNKTAQWNGSCPQFQSTSLYILSYVFTCKSDHFSCSFDLTRFRKRTTQTITWNERRNAISPLVDVPVGALFFGVLHFLQIWASQYPLKIVHVEGFVGRGGGGWGGMRYCNVVSEIAISSECECFDHLLVPSSG